MIDAILDTGPLVGALDADDQWHSWTVTQWGKIQQPALTCEAVISEACFLLGSIPGARENILLMVERGILQVVPVLPAESPTVRALLKRYGKRMDYADACLVRLSELHRERTLITTDVEDFRIYRRFTRQAIPLMAPGLK